MSRPIPRPPKTRFLPALRPTRYPSSAALAWTIVAKLRKPLLMGLIAPPSSRTLPRKFRRGRQRIPCIGRHTRSRSTLSRPRRPSASDLAPTHPPSRLLQGTRSCEDRPGRYPSIRRTRISLPSSNTTRRRVRRSITAVAQVPCTVHALREGPRMPAMRDNADLHTYSRRVRQTQGQTHATGRNHLSRCRA